MCRCCIDGSVDGCTDCCDDFCDVGGDDGGVKVGCVGFIFWKDDYVGGWQIVDKMLA